jgi:hypothetical protein
MPACTRLLQTEILPQNASRRRDGDELLRIVRVTLDQDGHVELGQLERVGHAFFVAESSAGTTSTPSISSACFLNSSAHLRASLCVSTPPSLESLSPSWIGFDAELGEEFGDVRRASVTSASGKKSRLP